MLLAQMEADDQNDEQLRHNPDGNKATGNTRQTAYFDDEEKNDRASRAQAEDNMRLDIHEESPALSRSSHKANQNDGM